MYTDERVYDATAKRSGCCLRSLIVIQEVARYHLHNTWARTKSCIIPSSLARLRYRFALYFPFSLGWKKKKKNPCVVRVRQSGGSARIHARQQPPLSASVRSLLPCLSTKIRQAVRSIRLGRVTRREFAWSSRPSYASWDLQSLKPVLGMFNRRLCWIFIPIADLKNYFYALVFTRIYLFTRKDNVKKDR